MQVYAADVPEVSTTYGTATYDGITFTYSSLYSSVTVIGTTKSSIPATVKIKYKPNADSTGTTYTLNVSKVGNGSSAISCPSSSITVSSSIPTISNYAFRNTGITGITYTNSSGSVGSYAFSGCSSLTSVKLGTSSSNTIGSLSLGTDVFNGAGLTSIIVDRYSIPSYTFYNCSSLNTIELKSSVSSIGSYAFYGAPLGTKITINSNLNTTQFQGKSVGEIVIGSNATTINSDLFKNCSSATKLTIGSNVTSIGSNAFYGCSNLTKLKIPGKVTTIKSSAFENCSRLSNICYTYSDNGTTKTADNSFNKTVNTIESNAFKGCTSLEKINTVNVTNIGDGAFQNSGIKTLILNKKLSSLGSNAFAGTKVETLTYKCANLNTSFVFKDFTTIQSLTIDAAVTQIPSCMFEGCTNLKIGSSKATTLKFPDKCETIGHKAFKGCSKLTGIDTNKLKGVGDETFANCTGLTSITLGTPLSQIGDKALQGCTSLDKVVYKCKNLYYVGNTFRDTNCPAKTLVFGSGIESIPYSCFKNNTNLKYVILKNKSTSDLDNATNLTGYWSNSLNVGNLDKVKVVGAYAFYGCKNVKVMVYPRKAEYIGYRAYDLQGVGVDEGATQQSVIEVEQYITPASDYTESSVAKIDIRAKAQSGYNCTDYVLAIDVTGSMTGTFKFDSSNTNKQKFVAERQAVQYLIDQIANENSTNRITIITWNGTWGTLLCDRVHAGNNRQTLKDLAEKLSTNFENTSDFGWTHRRLITAGGGGTDYANGLVAAARWYVESSADSLGVNHPALCFISDGEANRNVGWIPSLGAVDRSLFSEVTSIGIKLEYEASEAGDTADDPDDTDSGYTSGDSEDDDGDSSDSTGSALTLKTVKSLDEILEEYKTGKWSSKRYKSKPLDSSKGMARYLASLCGYKKEGNSTVENFEVIDSGPTAIDDFKKAMADYAKRGSEIITRGTVVHYINGAPGTDSGIWEYCNADGTKIDSLDNLSQVTVGSIKAGSNSLITTIYVRIKPEKRYLLGDHKDDAAYNYLLVSNNVSFEYYLKTSEAGIGEERATVSNTKEYRLKWRPNTTVYFGEKDIYTGVIHYTDAKTKYSSGTMEKQTIYYREDENATSNALKRIETPLNKCLFKKTGYNFTNNNALKEIWCVDTAQYITELNNKNDVYADMENILIYNYNYKSANDSFYSNLPSIEANMFNPVRYSYMPKVGSSGGVTKLYVNWYNNRYKVVYHTNSAIVIGGNEVTYNKTVDDKTINNKATYNSADKTYEQTCYYDIDLDLIPVDKMFERKGYTFIGWYYDTGASEKYTTYYSNTEKNGNSKSLTDGNRVVNLSNLGNKQDTIDAEIHLYAIWKKTVTLTFKMNNGNYKLSGDDVILSGDMWNYQNTYTFNITDGLTEAKYSWWSVQRGKIDGYGKYDIDGLNNKYTYNIENGEINRFLGWAGTENIDDADAKNSREPRYKWTPYNDNRDTTVTISDNTVLYAIWEPMLQVNLKLSRTMGEKKFDNGESTQPIALGTDPVSRDNISTIRATTINPQCNTLIIPGEQGTYELYIKGNEIKSAIKFDTIVTDIYNNVGIWTDNSNPSTTEDLTAEQKHGLDRLISGKEIIRKFYVPKYFGTSQSFDSSKYADRFNVWFTVLQPSYYYGTKGNTEGCIGTESLTITGTIYTNSKSEVRPIPPDKPVPPPYDEPTILNDLRTRLKIRIK